MAQIETMAYDIAKIAIAPVMNSYNGKTEIVTRRHSTQIKSNRTLIVNGSSSAKLHFGGWH